jgi:hypothetical protein
MQVIILHTDEFADESADASASLISEFGLLLGSFTCFPRSAQCVSLFLRYPLPFYSVVQFRKSVHQLTGQIGGSLGGDHEHCRILTGGVGCVKTLRTLYVFGGSLHVFLDFELRDH